MLINTEDALLAGEHVSPPLLTEENSKGERPRRGQQGQNYLWPTPPDDVAPRAPGSPGPEPFPLCYIKEQCPGLTSASYTASDDRFTR